MTRSQAGLCTCAICSRKASFAVPQQLLDALKSRKVVIFAGAGISTEDTLFFPETLYQEVASELAISGPSALSFPELMSAFCRRPDGRRHLLLKIQARI